MKITKKILKKIIIEELNLEGNTPLETIAKMQADSNTLKTRSGVGHYGRDVKGDEQQKQKLLQLIEQFNDSLQNNGFELVFTNRPEHILVREKNNPHSVYAVYKEKSGKLVQAHE